MSSKALRQFVSGALNPKGNLGDFQHAARLFVDSDLRLAPKQKFLYHVSFNINTNALKNLNFKFQHQNEVNMLVKTADLPKFTVQTDTLNQYNRKKVVQVKLDYQPITIRFHDDNLGVIGQLWQNYFGYYYGDSSAANIPGAYNRTAMRSPSFIRGRYGLDNNSAIPFFSDITIYQLAKKAWYSYKLVNPVITAWNHDSLDYSSSATSEQSCTIAYESVAYNTGYTFPGNPPGFALEHYDKTPSPISLAGGGTTSLFGPGGVIPGVAQIFGSVGSGAAFQDPATFISTAIQAVNSYQNAKNLSSAGIRQEATKIGITYGSYLLSQGFKFLVNDPNTSTRATPRDF
jgi:hypothetical protein